MMDAIVRNLLADIGYTPEDLREIMRACVAKIDDAHSRLERIEAKLDAIEERIGRDE